MRVVVGVVLMGALIVSVSRMMRMSECYEYHHGYQMAPIQPLRTTRALGHEVVDLPLPGDEGPIINYRTMLAIKRDNRLTHAEREVYVCELVKWSYGTDHCIKIECSWCGGMGWSPHDESRLFDVWP